VLQRLDDVRDDFVRWATSDIPRVPTGFSFIDEPTNGGPAPGELLLFIARSGVGKTWWALNVLAANSKTPAIFFSLEMHNRYLLKRLSAIYTNTPTGIIEKQVMADGWSPYLDKTAQDFRKLRFMDVPGIGIGDMMQAGDEYFDEVGTRPKLIIVDFMELVQVFGATDTENVKKLAKSLKDMARSMDAVVLVLHQVSRGVAIKRRNSDVAYTNEGHRPLSKGDAMHGGENNSDYMIGMFRPGLDPEMPPWKRNQPMVKQEIRLQFLKTRGDEDIDPNEHHQYHWDQPTGRITKPDFSIYR
jgi:KaiC/GvpD/RAD55 family RecA-like ATPase